jgi:hypothetical protein
VYCVHMCGVGVEGIAHVGVVCVEGHEQDLLSACLACCCCCCCCCCQVDKDPVLSRFVDSILRDYFSTEMPPPPADDPSTWSDAAQVGGWRTPQVLNSVVNSSADCVWAMQLVAVYVCAKGGVVFSGGGSGCCVDRLGCTTIL